MPLRILRGFRKPQKGLQLGFLIWGDPWFRRRFRFHVVKLTGGCLRFVFDNGLRIWKFLHISIPNSARSFCPIFSGWDMWDAQIESVDVSVSNWRLNLSNWGKGETLNARKPTCQLHQKAGKHSETWKCRFPSIVASFLFRPVSNLTPHNFFFRSFVATGAYHLHDFFDPRPLMMNHQRIHITKISPYNRYESIRISPMLLVHHPPPWSLMIRCLVSRGWLGPLYFLWGDFIGEFEAKKIRYAWICMVCVSNRIHDVLCMNIKKNTKNYNGSIWDTAWSSGFNNWNCSTMTPPLAQRDGTHKVPTEQGGRVF